MCAGALRKISLLISQQRVLAEIEAFTLSNVYGGAESRVGPPFVNAWSLRSPGYTQGWRLFAGMH